MLFRSKKGRKEGKKEGRQAGRKAGEREVRQRWGKWKRSSIDRDGDRQAERERVD